MNGKVPTFVFVVQEMWLPEDMSEVKGAGSRVLGVFNNLPEANKYADDHVRTLEHEVKRPARTTDETPLDEDDSELEVEREVEIFRGSYERTVPGTKDDGGMKWTVYWGDKTVVFVEKQEVHQKMKDGEIWVPMHDPTF